jgi:signal peptidase I
VLIRIYNHFLAPKIRLARASAAARSSGLLAFQVLGGNMEPTLRLGEVALYKRQEPSSLCLGDVVTLAHQSYFEGVKVPLRIVGLAGDRVELKAGQLYLNGQVNPEPYQLTAAAESEYSRDFPCTSVPEAHAFLLGDCRDNSKDSRLLGPIPFAALVGKIVLVHPLDNPREQRPVR